MMNKWDQRGIDELYAGAGYSLVKDTRMDLKGSPLIAFTAPNPFDMYIFCERDDEKMEALKSRLRF